jgi:hypothetical protein
MPGRARFAVLADSRDQGLNVSRTVLALLAMRRSSCTATTTPRRPLERTGKRRRGFPLAGLKSSAGLALSGDRRELLLHAVHDQQRAHAAENARGRPGSVGRTQQVSRDRGGGPQRAGAPGSLGDQGHQLGPGRDRERHASAAPTAGRPPVGLAARCPSGRSRTGMRPSLEGARRSGLGWRRADRRFLAVDRPRRRVDRAALRVRTRKSTDTWPPSMSVRSAVPCGDQGLDSGSHPHRPEVRQS